MDSELTWVIKPEDIEWEIRWDGVREDGTRRYPDKPESEMRFEEEPFLALMLINDIIFINNHWWKKDWPEDARKATALNVNCNDIFAWGCADAEEVTVSELKDLYHMVMAYPRWGSSLWCMKKRREMPQDAVAKVMVRDGVDLEAFKMEHNLRTNFYSGLSLKIAKYKYEVYALWAAHSGLDIRPFDKHWWTGWKEFTEANPGWEKGVGVEVERELRKQFIEQGGWAGEAEE